MFLTKRLNTLFISICIVLTLLVGKLAYISILNHAKYTIATLDQRYQSISISSPIRGLIYDSAMFPLTSSSSTLCAIVNPQLCNDIPKASAILNADISPTGIQVFPVNIPLESQTQLFSIPGVTPLSVTSSTNNSTPLAPNLIGYINSEGDGFGIEKAFNSYLKPSGVTGLNVELDAHNKQLIGSGVQVLGATKKGVQLTIDHTIQKICEKHLSENIAKGSAIVIDAKTNNILAMASTPTFDITNIEGYLNSQNGEFINRAITAYDLGSIFKIITTSCALEQNFARTTDTFTCHGGMDISSRFFACANENGHGTQTLSQAFASSCNIPFFNLGMKIGTDKINSYATSFGLGTQTLPGIDIGENPGGLSLGNTLQERASMAIGQGALQATPLQVANIVSTIVNDGIKKPLNLVQNYIADDGITTTPFTTEQNSGERIISAKTAQAIFDMMLKTVENGTGTNAKIKDYGAGGKTSSAETGWVDNSSESGETMVHGWFAGFFPADNPKYICVIMAENGRSGGASCAPVFKMIGESIMQNE
ncbi:MAG: penicillin-binding protein 2 [Clostridiales bacterium]|jgi:cell division protein FtsI/penicillin-binding protein 2|nr:penicillin-binding protein 2 [Clostridiales bacterium]